MYPEMAELRPDVFVVVGDAETQLDRVKKAGLGEVIVVNKEGVPEK